MRIRIAALLLVINFIFSAQSFAGEYELPTPIPAPKGTPEVPQGEKQFMLWGDRLPGVRAWNHNIRGAMWHYATTHSVGDGAGMYLYAPAGKEPANVCFNDTGVVTREKDGKVIRDDISEFKGISMWFKGDGSDATAVISWSYTGGAKNPNFRILLKDTNWHKVFIPWEKWSPPLEKGKTYWLINFGIERADNSKANWYIVDRVHYYKEEKVEEIKPTPDTDPKGNLPALAFVSGREYIKNSIAKLEKKEKIRIVTVGDSLICGAQMGYAAKSYTDKGGDRKYWCWPVYGQRLKDFYKYDNMSMMHRWFDPKTKVWSDKPFNDQGADLDVFAVAKGGFKTDNMLPYLDQTLSLKPDLVIWELGTNDLAFGNLETYKKCTREAIDKFRETGAEVLMFTPTPSASRGEAQWVYNKVKPYTNFQDASVEFMKAAKEIAAEKKCALADVWGAYMARGAIFTGDLYNDLYHPNHIGHEMIADLVDALITQRDVKIWKYGPVVEGK